MQNPVDHISPMYVAAAAPFPVSPNSVLQLNPSSATSTVIVFFCAFCLVFLWAICHRIVSRRRTATATALRDHRHFFLNSSPLPPTAASTPLPSMPYGSVKGVKAKETISNPPEDCVVCLTKFEEEEEVKVIPTCAHVFHPQCIDRWLALNDSCPLCRCSGISVSKAAV